MLNKNIYLPEPLECKEIGKNFPLFAMCHSGVTHLYKGIGLVGGGRIFKDNALEDLFDVDVSVITKGFQKLEEQGYIITSKKFSQKRSIAVVGFNKYAHEVDCMEEYNNRFDEIFDELDHNILYSLWDVKKIKNSRWMYTYLDIHGHMVWSKANNIDQSI